MAETDEPAGSQPAGPQKPTPDNPSEGVASPGPGDGVSRSKADRARRAQEGAAAQAAQKPSPARKKRSFWIELPILVLVAVLVAVLVRTFLLQTFYIPSGSMEQTLLPDDRVLVNKIVYDFRDPGRGEVVVFMPPDTWNVEGSKDDYIKRVIGVGGDRVVCCDSKGRIRINGTPLQENYLYPGNAPSNQPFDVTVPKGRLFVMGDHRQASADSRAHIDADPKYHGTIPISSVVGRAFAVFWPLNRMGSLSVPDAFDAIGGPRG